jgi:hypothetical protein
MRISRFERGQALILIVLSIFGLFGVVALVVDGGNAFVQTRRAQSAADAAALGGALSRIRGEDWEDAAYAIAAQQGFENDTATAGVAVNSPPLSGPYEGNIEYIQVVIGARVRTYLASVVGIPYIQTSVQAVARTKSSEIAEILDGSAVISLAPRSDCSSQRAFWVHGEATLSVTGADIFINSNNEDCALIEQGSGSIFVQDGEIVVVGGASIQKPQLITPYPPRTGSVPIAYPPPFFMPSIGCKQDAVIAPDGTTMSSGSWYEDFPPPGVTTLEPGEYCLEGDFHIGDTRTLQGHDVVFEVSRGRVRWSGTATINLDAPSAGPLDGLLVYLPPENHNVVVLNADRDSAIMGTILAPGSEVRLNGAESESGFHSQIIAYRVEVDGQQIIWVRYLDEQNWDAITMPEIHLAQ